MSHYYIPIFVLLRFCPFCDHQLVFNDRFPLALSVILPDVSNKFLTGRDTLTLHSFSISSFSSRALLACTPVAVSVSYPSCCVFPSWFVRCCLAVLDALFHRSLSYPNRYFVRDFRLLLLCPNRYVARDFRYCRAQIDTLLRDFRYCSAQIDTLLRDFRYCRAQIDTLLRYFRCCRSQIDTLFQDFRYCRVQIDTFLVAVVPDSMRCFWTFVFVSMLSRCLVFHFCFVFADATLLHDVHLALILVRSVQLQLLLSHWCRFLMVIF